MKTLPKSKNTMIKELKRPGPGKENAANVSPKSVFWKNILH
jgi:hypothetical protein